MGMKGAKGRQRLTQCTYLFGFNLGGTVQKLPNRLFKNVLDCVFNGSRIRAKHKQCLSQAEASVQCGRLNTGVLGA